MLSHFLMSHYNLVGLIGVFLVLFAYLMLQLDRLSQDGVFFSLANVIGSVLILISLDFTWNLSSGVIEIAWLVISTFGLIKSLVLRSRRRKKNG